MKRKLRFILLFLMIVGIQKICYSYDFQVQGLAYEITSSEERKVSVVSKPSPAQYSGEVVIPSTVEYDGITYTVTSIGNQAFYLCRYLTAVTIPNSVESIGRAAFVGCWELTQINIPGNVHTVGEQAFFDCTSLNSLILSEGISTIGKAAFAYCRGLRAITIPNSISIIEAEAFSECKFLTNIAFIGSLNTIEKSVFSGCLSLQSLALPEGVESIGANAFSDCSSLTELTLPATLKTIDSAAFNEFDESYAEMNLYCEAINPPMISGSYSYFYNSPSLYKNATLFVPKESLDDYSNSTGWGKFEKIKPITIEDSEDNRIMLSVVNPNQGEIIYQYPYGYEATFSINPADDWNIESVRFNGIEIKSDSNGLYSTGNLTEDGELEIIYSQTTTEIQNVTNRGTSPNIYCRNREIIIEGLNENELVTVYNDHGGLVYLGYNNRIKIDNLGSVLIVTIGHKSYKLVAR